MDNLLIELECPICTDYLTVPIRQCSTGHSICEKCIKKLERCALCQADFTESRNLTLEGLALKMTYPCVNKNAGCTDLLAYADRDKHELRCQFKGFQTVCAMKGCSFIGNEASMKAHWAAKKTSKIYSSFNSSFTKLKNDSFYVNLAECFGELFWFKCKTFNNTLYFATQLIGKPGGANKYYFDIEIVHTDTPRRRVILGNNCKSIELSDNELFTDENCCMIGFGNVSSFIVNDGLKYLLKFYKEGGPANIKGGKNDKKQAGHENKSQNESSRKPKQSENSKPQSNKCKPSNDAGNSNKGKSQRTDNKQKGKQS
ncbi:hypothetical protein WA026_023138 [Henosepilachna vigintioctopunctata]|uniref:E3 ubiquitin-protein ligase n=1 Tax=Henosepilachna vigintioctopunctata TaxID=420089 RepID=A0AAW1TPX6_9CUCU